jgi:predicted dehydrogenase
VLSHYQSADSAPVPTEFSAELLFAEGVSASFYCSFVTELQQWVHVSGTKGSLQISDFVLPYFGSQLRFDVSNPFYRISGCDFNMEPNTRRPTVAEYSNSHPRAQESNLFRNFASQIRSGSVNDEWFEIALKTQQVLEACRDSARSGGSLVAMA